jgi:hypothetical protein
MIRRALAVTTLATAALGVFALPGHAASGPNPCKLLKTSEISQQFGNATVSPGKKGLSTAISQQCEFEVAASGEMPDGTVIVHVLTLRGKAAYDGLKKPDTGYVPVVGLPNSLWAEKVSTVDVLKGGTLVGVQSLFTKADSLPITQVDTKAQSVALVKVAAKRL